LSVAALPLDEADGYSIGETLKTDGKPLFY